MAIYTIGQVAKMMGITTYTLRFYDKEGLLPYVRKNSVGIRRFTEDDVRWLQLVECLKATGMPLKEIKRYIDLAQKGQETVEARLQMLLDQKANISRQIDALQENILKINFKIRYYQAALKFGENEVWKNCPDLAAEREKLFNH